MSIWNSKTLTVSLVFCNIFADTQSDRHITFVHNSFKIKISFSYQTNHVTINLQQNCIYLLAHICSKESEE